MWTRSKTENESIYDASDVELCEQRGDHGIVQLGKDSMKDAYK
jgi:hypothetical protein